MRGETPASAETPRAAIGRCAGFRNARHAAIVSAFHAAALVLSPCFATARCEPLLSFGGLAGGEIFPGCGVSAACFDARQAYDRSFPISRLTGQPTQANDLFPSLITDAIFQGCSQCRQYVSEQAPSGMLCILQGPMVSRPGRETLLTRATPVTHLSAT